MIDLPELELDETMGDTVVCYITKFCITGPEFPGAYYQWIWDGACCRKYRTPYRYFDISANTQDGV
jgi:hypothetical protein